VFLVLLGLGEDLSDRVFGEVAALDKPLVVLLDEED
jgi:hypothetical protein